MSTAFEEIKGESYYINYEKESTIKELERMRRLMMIG